MSGDSVERKVHLQPLTVPKEGVGQVDRRDRSTVGDETARRLARFNTLANILAGGDFVVFGVNVADSTIAISHHLEPKHAVGR